MIYDILNYELLGLRVIHLLLIPVVVYMILDIIRVIKNGEGV